MIATCNKCAATFEAQDLSNLFACNTEATYTCDDCYRKVQEAGKAAAREVSEASAEFRNSDD